MARAHVHVATSVREGWGLVVSEAAALGTPTVAYDVPGLRDSTRAAGGVVVPPTPDALVAWLPVGAAAVEGRAIRRSPTRGGAHSWDVRRRSRCCRVADCSQDPRPRPVPSGRRSPVVRDAA